MDSAEAGKKMVRTAHSAQVKKRLLLVFYAGLLLLAAFVCMLLLRI